MRLRPITWFLLSLMFFLAAAVVWRWSNEWQAARRQPGPPVEAPAQPGQSGAASPTNATQSSLKGLLSTPPVITSSTVTAARARFPYQLSNSTKKIDEMAHQLVRDGKSVLLGNALIDTESPAALPIPAHLRAQGDPGSYVVQSRGLLDDAFRSLLQSAGAEIISYIPNDAYLVRLSASGARLLANNPRTQTVLPFEPYYKLDETLLKLAVEQKPMPAGRSLNLLLFPGERNNAAAELARLGAEIVSEDRSPFGPVLTVRSPADSLVVLANLPAVQGIEPHFDRRTANDLSRVRVGVSPDTTSATNNYLGLTGSGITVNVNDSGVDATHPDLAGRVTGDAPGTLLDPVGHGTHVAGTIISSGEHSPAGTNASGSLSNANFHGIAPQASVYALRIDNVFGPAQGDTYLQERTASNHVFISNNSWNYIGANAYNIAASSYDAAVRDALPGQTGSQPLLFVFSAGNAGFGNDSGLSGEPGSIESPATAKNVITVGAIEQLRNLTNEVVVTNYFTDPPTVTTNQPFLRSSDSDDQVANFSSRGNVGIGIEGSAGRFKPDVVAPGTFVVSTRSSQWDTAAYYDPTNNTVNTFVGQIVQPGVLNNYSIFVPDNAVQLRIFLVPNPDSPSPFPNLPIYVKQGDFPSTSVYDLLKTNSVSLPPDLGPTLTPVGTTWFYSVGNPTTSPANFNLVTVLTTVNDSGNYFQVLSNLNERLKPYRYESGTSMSAADVSGTLALMQEFFEQRLGRTNSPALMKALLINGARSAGPLYDFQIDNFINFQGWGLINLPNSLPGALTNIAAPSSSLQFFDQTPTAALATGQRKTRNLKLTPAAQSQPLRVTLVWTDPPGNPAASLKLVNDLDLIVTNLDTGKVYYGNDIPAGSDFNQPVATNGVPNRDVVNNVENVYLPPPLGSNYNVTVFGRRVNVNAVTAQTNNVSQDYALVISSGNGEESDAITLQGDNPTTFSSAVALTIVTNNSVPLLNQRVGANSALVGTTNGVTNQWHFYVFTNNTFTNVAFLTFLPPDLSIPRIGTRESDLDNATRIEADIDLYVSTNATILNLDPLAVATAFRSRSRGGTETIAFSNAPPNQVYYIGVKSEDQMAAEYGFLGLSSRLPFSERDANGNLIVHGIPIPTIIPDGTPSKPGAGLVFGIATEPVLIRRAVVTNIITHESMGDLLGNLSHGNNFVVLNNHRSSPGPGAGPYLFLYDDSNEGTIPGAMTTDGPGSLRKFVGEEGLGQWLLTMVDNSLGHTGRVDGLTIRLEPQQMDTNGVLATIAGQHFFYDFIDVPAEATNLTVTIQFVSPGTTPVELYLRRGDFPSRTVYDKFAVINPPAGALSISLSDSPPLNPGRYYIGVFNPSLAAVTVRIITTLGLALAPAQQQGYTAAGSLPILDDAVTVATKTVTNDDRIVSAEVGVRIDHPRVSDLVLTLISPRGTRVLLAENRGGASPDGYGSTLFTTNVLPQTTSGGAAANTNVIQTSQNQGTVRIDYNFETVPDTMHIYYDGVRIYDTGLINGTGTFSVNYGPGTSTAVTIIMNEGGNSDTNTAWSYSATIVSGGVNYATFTEDTRLTTTPIKFATPPFTGLAAFNLLNNGFEAAAAGNYAPPAVFDGWTVVTNQVTVIRDPALAYAGTNLLALADGRIERVLPTVAGKRYLLSFANRGPGIVSLWRGESNANDSADGNPGTLRNGVTFLPGEVGQALNFDGFSGYVEVPSSPGLKPTNTFTVDAWVNYDRITGFYGDTIVAKGLDAEAPVDWALTISTARKLRPHVKVGAAWVFFDCNTLLNASTWYHVAMVYDGANLRGFVNGVQDGVQAAAGALQASDYPLRIGAYAPVNGIQSTNYFAGRLDEVSIYDRALSASEMKAIYAAGTAGKFDPLVTLPQGLAKAQISVDGVPLTTVFGNNETWQTKSITFTAAQNGTVLDVTGLEPGMLLDSFTLTELGGDVYYLPESSLDVLKGENALGDWKLEILDNRAGAFANGPQLMDWKLHLVFENTVPVALPLTFGEPVTNTVAGYSSKCFFVDVPYWARFATNTLFNTTEPLDLIFNQNGLPGSGIPGDVVLLTGVFTAGTNTLSTTGVPPLQPGQRYYLCVTNPNPTSVDFSIEVDFDITTLTNAVAVTGDLDPALIPRYFQFDVSTNAEAVVFELFNLSGNVDLVARRGPPLPDLNSYDYGSFNGATTNEAIVVFKNSFPVPLAPGRWYLGVFNRAAAPVNYTIRATEFTNAQPVIIGYQVISNSFCITWTSFPGVSYYVQGKTNLNDPLWNPVSPTIVATDIQTTYCIPLPSPYHFFRVVQGTAPGIPPGPGDINTVPGNSISYFFVDVPAWASYATNTILTATGPLNLLFNQNGLPNGTNASDFMLLTNVTSGSATLATNGVPPLLPGQRYYLGVQNTNANPVTFRIQVEFNVTTLLNGVPITSILNSGPIPRSFQFDVSTNAVALAFQILNPSGNVDLVVHQGPPIPDLNLFDYGSFNPGTANETITVRTNSAPIPVTPGLWCLSVFNRDTVPVNYTIRATEFTNTQPNIIRTGVSNNNYCLTWSSIPGVNYLVQGKTNVGDTNWTTISPTVVAVDTETTYCIPLPSPYHFFRVIEGSAPVNFSSITVTTNGVLLQWMASPNQQFQVQWSPSLAPATWTTFTNIITSATSNFSFLDDGSQTGGLGATRYYRLLLYP